MKLSIITINYNHKEGLLKTIKSVVNQTYHDIEYIVIDGGSTDGSVDVVKQYEDSISYWVSEPDCGIYNAMNKGVAKATGEYCLFLNSGDILHGNEVIAMCIPELDSELVIGKVLTYPDGRLCYTDIQYPITMHDFFTGGPIPHDATFIKRELIEAKGYDENYKIVSDWKFFIEKMILDNCSYKLIDTVVSEFEVEGISSDKVKCEKEREEILKSILPPAIYLDYQRFSNGADFSGDEYDNLFADIKKFNRKCAKLIYTFSVLIVQVLSITKKSLRFIKKYPLKSTMEI